MPLADIKELLGHSDLATTQRYAHFDGQIRGSLQILNQVLAGSTSPQVTQD